MRRMSSDPTAQQPVVDPTTPVEAMVIPPPRAPVLEPERSGDGSAVDGFHPNRRFAPIDEVTTGGVAASILDVAIGQDTAHHPGGVPGPASRFAAVARALASELSVDVTLQQLIEMAGAIVPGCHHAGVTVLRRGRPETPAATDEVSAEVDRIQYETGEGPCLAAVPEWPTYRTGDLSAETRWPSFAGTAAERTGVLSVLAYRLFTEGDTVGALNLYSRERDAFDDEAEAIGTILAAHAALVFARTRERERIAGLEQALVSNRSIGMAIGILMAIRRIGQDEAFDLLRRVSQRTNRKLREIADEVVHTGQLPEAPPG